LLELAKKAPLFSPMLKIPKIKSERREELARKAGLKQKKGGTLAGQVLRTRVAGFYLRMKKSKQN